MKGNTLKVKQDKATFIGDKKGWLLFHYLPTAFFSLRMTYATNKGGKTLLVPTPYSMKLAFVDASFRMEGKELAEEVLEWLKDKEIRFSPPEHCIVQNTFLRVLQEDRNAPKGYFTHTIAYREFCSFHGIMTVAININDLGERALKKLQTLGAHINYLGKRGSFFQFIGTDEKEILPDGFSHPGHDQNIRSNTYGVSNFLDDFGEDALKDKNLFDRISTYGKSSLTLGKHRVLTPTLLPYRLVSSSHGFSHYQRIDLEEKSAFEN